MFKEYIDSVLQLDDEQFDEYYDSLNQEQQEELNEIIGKIAKGLGKIGKYLLLLYHTKLLRQDLKVLEKQ